MRVYVFHEYVAEEGDLNRLSGIAIFSSLPKRDIQIEFKTFW